MISICDPVCYRREASNKRKVQTREWHGWLREQWVTPTSLERWARQEAQGRVRRLWQQQEEDNKALASTDEEGRYSCESGEAYHLLQALWPSRKLLTCAKTIAIILGVFNRTFPSSMDRRTNIAFWHTPYFHPSSLLIMRKSCSVPGMGGCLHLSELHFRNSIYSRGEGMSEGECWLS